MPSLAFGPFTLDPSASQLWRDGVLLDLQPLLVDLLGTLAAAAPATVSRQALTAALWPDVQVTTHSLDQALYRLRRALGPHAAIVVTVPRQGFRLELPVRRVVDADPAHHQAQLPERQALLEQLWLLLAQDQARVLLWGPPGVGRSAVLHALAARLPGARLLDLDGVDSAEVLAARLPAAPGGLLLVDHPEALPPEALRLLGDHLAGTVAAVVASRARLPALRTSAEVWVPPLSLPGAVRVFAQAARRVQPALPWEDAATLASLEPLCAALEGLPLLLELAAARARWMSVADIAAALEALPDWPPARRDAPARHTSLRAALSPSLSALPPEAARHIAQLAAFQGAFSAQAAARVAQTTPADLAGLRDTGLLAWSGETGRVWAGVREAVRQRWPAPEALRRHAAWALEDPEAQDAELVQVARRGLGSVSDQALLRLTARALAEGPPDRAAAAVGAASAAALPSAGLCAGLLAARRGDGVAAEATLRRCPESPLARATRARLRAAAGASPLALLAVAPVLPGAGLVARVYVSRQWSEPPPLPDAPPGAPLARAALALVRGEGDGAALRGQGVLAVLAEALALCAAPDAGALGAVLDALRQGRQLVAEACLLACAATGEADAARAAALLREAGVPAVLSALEAGDAARVRRTAREAIAGLLLCEALSDLPDEAPPSAGGSPADATPSPGARGG